MKKKLLLIDGSLYLYRAHYGCPQVYNKSGLPVGLIHGFLKIIFFNLKKISPSHLLIVFDAPGGKFRHSLLSSYKANRKKMPNIIQQQIQPLQEVIRSIGFATISQPSVESDDVIGTVVKSFCQNLDQILIMTNDKDMAQLVDKKVFLVHKPEVILGIDEVKKKYGIPPDLVVDYLALIGDICDNIPGVSGIGRKTALMLLEKIGGLRKIYEEVKNPSSKAIASTSSLLEKLKKQEKEAFLSQKLATIKTNLNMSFNLNHLSIGQQESEKLSYFLGFAHP